MASAFVLTFDADHSPVEAAEEAAHIDQHYPEAALFAVDINWREEYTWCQHIGCHYAAGKLFASRSWPEGPIDPGFVRVLDTLNKLRQEAPPEVIAQTMKHDPLLTFRLLGQANSAALGLTRKIDTIEQAVVAIGRQRLYRWLVLLLYATAKGGENGAILQEMAQVRAVMRHVAAPSAGHLHLREDFVRLLQEDDAGSGVVLGRGQGCEIAGCTAADDRHGAFEWIGVHEGAKVGGMELGFGLPPCPAIRMRNFPA